MCIMFSHRVHPVRITTAVEERLVLAREDRETASCCRAEVYTVLICIRV